MSHFNETKAVGRLSEIVALEHGFTSSEATQIRTAAVLHDVGKQKIPENILKKPGKLTAAEFEIVKEHTKLGAAMLSSIQGTLGEMATLIALYHHEWQNPELGGYWGLSLYYLPEYVSFVAISDVFTSLISERPYKGAWPPEDALAYIQGQSGKQFSDELVGIFIPLIRNDSRVSEIYGEPMRF